MLKNIQFIIVGIFEFIALTILYKEKQNNIIEYKKDFIRTTNLTSDLFLDLFFSDISWPEGRVFSIGCYPKGHKVVYIRIITIKIFLFFILQKYKTKFNLLSLNAYEFLSEKN